MEYYVIDALRTSSLPGIRRGVPLAGIADGRRLRWFAGILAKGPEEEV